MHGGLRAAYGRSILETSRGRIDSTWERKEGLRARDAAHYTRANAFANDNANDLSVFAAA